MNAEDVKFIRMADQYWCRKRIRYGIAIQSFSKSSFGSSLGHGTRFGFGIFEFAKTRFGYPGPDRGPTSSFARIDNYRGYTGRLSKKCIKARGQLSAEEIYWPTGKLRQTSSSN